MDTLIYTFIKNKKRGTVGVVLASKKSNGHIGIGWSRCNVNQGDTFKKETALKIARGRAEKGTCDYPPHSMLGAIAVMQGRAAHYFKDCNVDVINSML
jgi:hypothetical protein